jgi:hypothetical protein
MRLFLSPERRHRLMADLPHALTVECINVTDERADAYLGQTIEELRANCHRFFRVGDVRQHAELRAVIAAEILIISMCALEIAERSAAKAAVLQ